MSDFKIGDVVYRPYVKGWHVVDISKEIIEEIIGDRINTEFGWDDSKEFYKTFAEAKAALLQKVQALEEV